MARPITIRLARPEDDEVLLRLAALDSATRLRGRVLLAEQEHDAADMTHGSREGQPHDPLECL